LETRERARNEWRSLVHERWVGGTWKEEAGGKVLKKAAGVRLKKLEP
jgi:hypothetical protein